MGTLEKSFILFENLLQSKVFKMASGYAFVWSPSIEVLETPSLSIEVLETKRYVNADSTRNTVTNEKHASMNFKGLLLKQKDP